jgi:hypothetical protein
MCAPVFARRALLFRLVPSAPAVAEQVGAPEGHEDQHAATETKEQQDYFQHD